MKVAAALALSVALSVALSLALPAAPATAATAYVSDELVLGVYAEQNNQGQRLTTLHSGASVETLQVVGEFTEVRLNDGTTGWVKSAYLTTQEPAIVRVKQLEEELDRSRATTPELAEAAARSEVEQLKRELAAKQSELDAARSGPSVPVDSVDAAAPGRSAASATASDAPAGPVASRNATSMGLTQPAGWAGTAMAAMLAAALHPWTWVVAMLVALACGFWLGYSVLARRIKHKFGGIKVY